MRESISEIIISRQAIEKRVKEIASELDEIYAGEPLAAICVLKGAFMFFADLAREMRNPAELDFVRIASYGKNTESGAVISFTKDIELSVKDKHVLLVDDIVDTGRSMEFLSRQFAARGVRSLRICAMIDKRERREADIRVDIAGFRIPSGFAVGYGLDYAERYRLLPEIRLLEFVEE